MLSLRRLNVTIYSPPNSTPILMEREPETKAPIFLPDLGSRESVKASFFHLDRDRQAIHGAKQEVVSVEGRISNLPNWLINGGTYQIDWDIAGRILVAELYIDFIGESALDLDRVFGIYIEGSVKFLKKK